MFRIALASLAAAASLGAASQASAAVTLASPATCNIYDLTGGGCRFTAGNPSEFNNDISGILAAYNAAFAVDIPLDQVLLGKAENDKIYDPADVALPGQTYADNGLNWQFQGLPFAVNFFVVKSSRDAILFGLNPANDSFTAYNTLITNNNGKLKDISHVTFFGSPGVVPEPATWAMLIIGFLGAGAVLRSRRQGQVLTA